MPANRDTPAMRQYDSFKRKYPDCLLFFRMGDFYELFDADAVTVHKALGLTLTQRSEGIPMAGVPFHSSENYFKRLITQGYRVAVCDQIQDPREAKGVIERAVTRVLTPGTLVDDALLDEAAPNTLAAAFFPETGDDPASRVGVAVVELSTGRFVVLDCAAGGLADELARRQASELIYAEPTHVRNGALTSHDPPARVKRVVEALNIPGTPRPSWHFRRDEALEALKQHYGVSSLGGFGLDEQDPAVVAAGAILRYLHETQALDTAGKPTSEGVSSGTPSAFVARPRSLAHLGTPRREDPSGTLMIDAVSLRALEVERTLRGWTASGGQGGGQAGTRAFDGSLVGLFLSSGERAPRTPMGKRLLRDWLCRPPAERGVIEERHAAVEALVNDAMLATALADALKGVQDVPRIAARVGLGRATPRDLVALGKSLGRVRTLASVIEGAASLKRLHAALVSVEASLAPLAARIAEICIDEPPAHLREGGLVRPGVDRELDEARTLQSGAGEWLAQYQASLIAEHDLPSLKVGYNKIFGFYIELPSAQSKRAPAVFSRKQTLKNAERYITPELKEYEDKVQHAEERALGREQALFLELCSRAAARQAESAQFAEAAAELDVLACFAARAVLRGWTRPVMRDEPVLMLRQARHPVLEELLADRFVPNDCALGMAGAAEAAGAAGEASMNPHAAALALITGPNMAGKSTYIRMVALVTLLAHAGSFVPAAEAKIGVTDRIFTRIGADDALHAGQSTFMVEMVETAAILNHASRRSLVILDEIGRGTSTLDGLSLAWAVAEYLAGDGGDQPRPRTLFATHYHEVTDLADRMPERVVNLQVSVREWEGQVIFLHRILPGRASRSYGIHVARLAGLPRGVVERADVLLESLSVSHGGAAVTPVPAAGAAREGHDDPPPLRLAGSAPRRQRGPQLALFGESSDHPAMIELKKLDINRLSPMQAFDALRRLLDMTQR